MSTINRDAIEWVQDELESRDARIEELEEELELALEDNQTLKAMLLRAKATLQMD